MTKYTTKRRKTNDNMAKTSIREMAISITYTKLLRNWLEKNYNLRKNKTKDSPQKNKYKYQMKGCSTSVIKI